VAVSWLKTYHWSHHPLYETFTVISIHFFAFFIHQPAVCYSYLVPLYGSFLSYLYCLQKRATKKLLILKCY